MKNIAIIDNYDSFTYNLVHLVEKVSYFSVDVFLNDKIDAKDLAPYTNIILSPGPGLPQDAGITPKVLELYASSKNILGVCLGMQAIGQHFNSPLQNLNTVMHGIATPINHLSNDFLFKDIPVNFIVGRYHSWVVKKDSLSPQLEVTATDQQGQLMAFKHKTLNVRGVQFHPESILSEYGETLMKNWIDNF